jgi:hypothetical protein
MSEKFSRALLKTYPNLFLILCVLGLDGLCPDSLCQVWNEENIRYSIMLILNLTYLTCIEYEKAVT